MSTPYTAPKQLVEQLLDLQRQADEAWDRNDTKEHDACKDEELNVSHEITEGLKAGHYKLVLADAPTS